MHPVCVTWLTVCAQTITVKITHISSFNLHIVLMTQSSFWTVRHPSLSVLKCGQPTVLTSTL